ncbi:MAG: 50S ribosomal protein L24 [Crocinitomicaceae bacterium]|tara:strand:- start:899 stop:1216 length:318 start_codon:yes stop_codon:yes gene_type:complete
MQKKLHIKIGDTVKAITGESKGQAGKVLGINREKLRATVEGLNMIKKHVKPSANNPQGSIEELEGTIHISNLMLVENDTATRTGKRLDENGKLTRYSKKSGEVIK